MPKKETKLRKLPITGDLSKIKPTISLANLPKAGHLTKVKEVCPVPVEEVNKLKKLIKISKKTQLLARLKGATEVKTTIHSVTRSRKKVILESMKSDYE